MSFRPDNVPLQEGIISMPSSGQFQYTNLEVRHKMPKDHFIWSLCCLLYFNPCCLGFAALVHSVKARDRKVLGDIEAAHNYASTARTLNIISTVIVCLFTIIFIIVFAVLIDQIVTLIHSIMAQSRSSDSRFDNSYFSG